ncbi:hypothetical protein E2C01_034823 [Portunus trituberculatus]|uniref:Uncharacterized protein n=1 Tax=Portunus trituberculatus TaxID=210409 RepID=A0A5B7F7D4_PORTR|nr:hypothetical protein [Portunus trituberculatus]
MNLDVLRFVLQMTRGNPVPSPSAQSPRVWVGAPGLPHSQPLKETAFFMPAGRDFPSALTAAPCESCEKRSQTAPGIRSPTTMLPSHRVFKNNKSGNVAYR